MLEKAAGRLRMVSPVQRYHSCSVLLFVFHTEFTSPAPSQSITMLSVHLYSIYGDQIMIIPSRGGRGPHDAKKAARTYGVVVTYVIDHAVVVWGTNIMSP